MVRIDLRWAFSYPLLLIVLIIGLDGLGFGLGPWWVVTPFGLFPALHLLSLASLLLAFALGVGRTIHARNPLSVPFLALLGLLFLSFARTGVTALLWSRPAPEDWIRNVLSLYLYAYGPALVLAIRQPGQLRTFGKTAVVVGAAAALIILICARQESGLPGLRVGGMAERTELLAPTVELMAGSLYAISALGMLSRSRREIVASYLLVALVGAGLVATGIRNTLVGTALVLAILGTRSVISSPRKSFRRLVIPLAVVLPIMYLGLSLLLNLASIGEDLASAAVELTERHGNAWFRVTLLQVSAKNVLLNYPILGRGFDWEPFLDFATYLNTGETYAPTNDSGLASILIAFGAVGAVIYGFVFYRAFRVASCVWRKTTSPWIRSMIAGCVGVNLHILVTSPFTNVFFGQPGTVVLVASWSVLFLLWEFTRNCNRVSWR